MPSGSHKEFESTVPGDLEQWVGRREVMDDEISLAPARLLAATLGRTTVLEPGDYVPPLWHWLYFLSAARTADLGADGHPRAGAFIPPIALPRRMWAGSRIEFRVPLRFGEKGRRSATISRIVAKRGRSGPLVFVRLTFEIEGPEGLAILEERDVVFCGRSPPNASPAPPRAPSGAHWTRSLAPDPVLLFRYSALTFNAHRIHYDQAYAVNTEGYPALVVHGPLIATLLAELLAARVPERTLKSMVIRSVSPAYVGETVTLGGRAERADAKLWAAKGEHELLMSTDIEFQ